MEEMKAGAAHPATGGMREAAARVACWTPVKFHMPRTRNCSSGCTETAKTELQAVPVLGQAEHHPPGEGRRRKHRAGEACPVGGVELPWGCWHLESLAALAPSGK